MLDEKLFWARLWQANDVAPGCPLYPRKQIFCEAACMSAKCHKRTLTDVPYPVHMAPNLVVEYYSR